MLKTLDILIGVATVMLLFSMAVTIVTQFVANLMQSRGKNLLQGLTGLLKQIDPNLPAEAANKIAETVLKHPLVAEANGKLGEVIHREEFTTLLMGLAAGEGAATLDAVTKKALADLLVELQMFSLHAIVIGLPLQAYSWVEIEQKGDIRFQPRRREFVHLLDQAQIVPTSIALVGRGGIGISIANDDLTRRQGRPDHGLDQMRARCQEEHQLGAQGDRILRREQN